MVAQPPAAPAPAAAPAPPPPANGTTPIQPMPVEMTTEPSGRWWEDYQHYHAWITGEYLLWRFGGSLLRSFNADIPAGNVPINAATTTFNNGAFLSSTAQSFTIPLEVQASPSLPGGNSVDFRDQPGFRITLGRWFGEDKCCGMEVNFFWLPERIVQFSDQLTVNNFTVDSGIAQQRIDITTSGGTTTVAGPNPIGDVFFTANLQSTFVARTTNEIWGFEWNLRSRCCYFGPAMVDLIGGWRFLEIHQTIDSSETFSILPSGSGQVPATAAGLNAAQPVFTGAATVPAPVNAVVSDSIKSWNRFLGPQFGASFEWMVSPHIFVSGYGKVGIGDMHQTFDVFGNTTGTAPRPGGIFVGGADAAHQSTDRVCFAPEGNLAVGYAFGPHFRVFAAYDILYLSAVSKLGNTLQTASTTNTITLSTGGGTTGTGSTSTPTGSGAGTNSLTASSLSPGIRIGSTDTSLQGLNLGVEIRW
jgi:hypothetical protein